MCEICDKLKEVSTKQPIQITCYWGENNRDFCTVGMFAAYDCWIYNDIGFNYNVDVFQRTLCKSKEDFEKGLQNAVMLKKKLLIKTKIDEIEREFK